MKVHVSLLGLIFLISFTSSAQRSRDPDFGRSRNPDFREDVSRADPFDLLQAQVNQATVNWPSSSIGRGSANGSAATVSYQQLQHKVSKQAFKEYKKGRAASSKGDNETALDHLQNAIQIDPEFTDAHNDLGVVLARLGNTGEAAEQFKKAVDLAPDHNVAVGNLSLAFYMLERYQEVIPLAQRALKINPGLPYVRYVLGVSLIIEHGDKKEALENLERVAPQFPEARVMASNILVQIGRRHEAARQLEEYLHSAPKGDTARGEIEARIAQLRQ
jgi:Flp pilus assembly protein TadD